MENWAGIGAILTVLVPILIYYMNRMEKKLNEVRKDIRHLTERVIKIEVTMELYINRPQIMPIEKHDDLKKN